MDASLEHPNASPRALRVAAAAFLLLVFAGPLTFLLLPKAHTQATPPWPEWSTTAFLDGHWAELLRVHLRESSPLTVTMRGIHGETEFLLGAYEGRSVTIGRGGWLFMSVNTVSERTGIAKHAAARRKVFADLARWSAGRGVSVLVVVPPDKARVYPELWAPGGELPPARRGEYRALLEELAAAGLPAVDLESAFLAWRRARPAEPLYQSRDTHWNRRGSLLAALAIADRLAELGLEEEFGPPEALTALPLQSYRAMPDLPGSLGFVPGGLFETQLLQQKRDGGVVRADSAEGLASTQPDSPVALCGDSFADAGLGTSLRGVLGLAIDTGGVLPGGGPIHGLFETVKRIDGGELRARILIWEFVERSQAGEGWAEGPVLPGSR